MVFSRFFKSAGNPEPNDDANEPASEPADEPADDAGESPEFDDVESPEALPDQTWLERAMAVLPTGSSAGSKRMEALWGAADAHAPSHYVSAVGCQVTTIDNETLIDCTMALGSVTLGYADERITSAVVAAMTGGNVAGLPHALEVDVAERFCEAVPCSEKVQFLKTGAEAVAAAVRLARTYTGRDHVIGCGYFGWHDWSVTESGVPAATRALYTAIPFGDVAALEHAVSAAGSNLAAIVIEPVVETLAPTEWVSRARELATQAGAALIFDEVKTGFRLAPGGYQEQSGITPDLSAFGKALANGFPLAAVCGSAALMDAARGTWISSTLAGEATALAAARVVLQLHAEHDVCADLARIGTEMRSAVSNAVRASRVPGISIEGIDPMWFLTFDSPALETRFLTASAANGILFKRGPYNFPSLAHDAGTIHEIESRTSNALVAIRDENEG
ncbi:MAG: aminotransferase class III-fold pyridoxal phosphate-dependent enzyme [Gemmatimonadetes bacterium]|nr:aminotransferase class III-fold pyridoxal phosphate-dependent enzyme [Gemmatimonadota bacterium]